METYHCRHEEAGSLAVVGDDGSAETLTAVTAKEATRRNMSINNGLFRVERSCKMLLLERMLLPEHAGKNTDSRT